MVFPFYYLDIFFLDTQKKICPNNKKDIYNDKYRHTSDRLFGHLLKYVCSYHALSPFYNESAVYKKDYQVNKLKKSINK
jgi:hypothetical protein